MNVLESNCCSINANMKLMKVIKNVSTGLPLVNELINISKCYNYLIRSNLSPKLIRPEKK